MVDGMNKEWKDQTDERDSFLIPTEWLKHCKGKSFQYIIGMDTLDDDIWVYCLGRDMGNHFEIILQKSMRDKKEFKEEVENLTKYFNVEMTLNFDTWK